MEMKVIKTRRAAVKRACPSFPALSVDLYYISQQTSCLQNDVGSRKVGNKWSCTFFGVQKQEGSLGGQQCFPVSSPGAAGWATRGEMLLRESKHLSRQWDLSQHGLSMAFSFPDACCAGFQ